MLLAVLAGALALGPGASFAAIARRSFQVKYSTKEQAERAVKELDGSAWEGQELSVRPADRDERQVFVSSPGALGSWERVGKPFKAIGQVRRWVMDATSSFTEVRYASPEEAESAVKTLDGSKFKGEHPVAAEREGPGSPRVFVHGLQFVGSNMKEIKKFLRAAGTVAFMKVHNHEAEVRFSTEKAAQEAIALDGSEVMGYTLRVFHPASMDNTKVRVGGLGAGIGRQELKDIFKKVGHVEFVGMPDGGRLKLKKA